MSTASKPATGTPASAAKPKGQGGNSAPARNRKQYDHEMTPRDRWALQQVINARNACNQLAEAIKSGKEVSVQAIATCSDLSRAAGEMLFK